MLGFLILFSAAGCTNKTVTEPPVEPEVLLTLPANFPPPVQDMSANPLTEKGVALGKKLFYDGILSRDGSVACGSCHIQASAFTHHSHDVSHGIDDRLGKRNGLPVFNMLWQKNFFWDGGVHNLDMTPLNALENPVEMDEKLGNVLEKLNNSGVYKRDFKSAFNVETITTKEFMQALSQFMATIVSAGSRYDKYVRKETGGTLTETEQQGRQLFEQKCAACHATELFTDGSFRNNGVSTEQMLRFDKGREEITLDANDRGKFRVPSLRNIEVTAPYMHRGQFRRLEQVLDYYASGVTDSPTLDPLLKQNGQLGIPLTAEEKQQIIAFLKTLTDNEFLTNPKFAEPGFDLVK